MTIPTTWGSLGMGKTKRERYCEALIKAYLSGVKNMIDEGDAEDALDWLSGAFGDLLMDVPLADLQDMCEANGLDIDE